MAGTTTGSNPQALFEIIQRIARHGLVDSKTGAVHGTERIIGYVVKIHGEGDGDLAGTIDVQEYIDYEHQNDIDSKVGYHEGVLLNAMQNSDCYLILPKLYSDVVIVFDVATQKEYVTMFSHVDTYKVDAHESLFVGVSERETFNSDDENAPDVDELKKTGLSSGTVYDKESIITSVSDIKSGNRVEQKITSTSFATDVNGKSAIKLDDKVAEVEGGDVKVKLSQGKVYLGDENAKYNAVLGQKLADVLSELLGYLSQMMTTTMMGPQPPANMIANFIKLKTTIESYKASCSGFLSNTVKVKE